MRRRPFAKEFRVGRALLNQGQFDDARMSFERAYAVAKEGQAHEDVVVVLFELGAVSVAQGDLDAAQERVSEAEGRAVVLRAPIDVGVRDFLHGAMQAAHGDDAAAVPYLSAAAERFLAKERVGLAAGALSKYALAVDTCGTATQAILAHTDAIRAWRELPSSSSLRHETVARHLELRAVQYARDIGVSEALGALGEACTAWTRADSPADVARVHHRVGDLWLRRGRADVAHGHFESAYNTYVAHGDQVSADRIRDEWIARRDVPSTSGPVLT